MAPLQNTPAKTRQYYGLIRENIWRQFACLVLVLQIYKNVHCVTSVEISADLMQKYFCAQRIGNKVLISKNIAWISVMELNEFAKKFARENCGDIWPELNGFQCGEKKRVVSQWGADGWMVNVPSRVNSHSGLLGRLVSLWICRRRRRRMVVMSPWDL